MNTEAWILAAPLLAMSAALIFLLGCLAFYPVYWSVRGWDNQPEIEIEDGDDYRPY